MHYPIESLSLMVLAVYMALRIPIADDSSGPWSWYDLIISLLPLIFGVVVAVQGRQKAYFHEAIALCVASGTLTSVHIARKANL